MQKWLNGTGSKTYWYGIGGETLAEGDAAGNLTAEFVYFSGKRTARIDLPANTVHYYLSDHLNSTSQVVSSAGVVEEESDYSPFGTEVVVAGPGANQYKFTGKERDSESGLDYFGARYYGNALGRFLVPDWAGKPITVPYANFGNPQSLNLYSYVVNNPMTLRDPDGHEVGYTYNHDGTMTAPTEATTDGHPIRDTLLLGAMTVTALAAPEAGPFLRGLLGLGLASAPVTGPIVSNVIEGLTPGAPGTLTVSTATRLTATEISTGVRLAEQTGKSLVQSEHVGAEFVDAAGKTYDAMGGGKAFEHFGDGASFMKSIVKHVNKSVDQVAIDLKGASKDQVGAIKDFVKTLTKDQQKKVQYVN